MRLRSLASEGNATLGIEVGAAARPTQLRTFADTPREEGEISLYAASFFGDRFGGRLQVTGAVDPDDDLPGRLDGSYVAGKFGNWIFTVGQQDRWWGSGWEGSLIMSNNARPVPEISIDRAVSMPFETKWLSWIGPWRLTTFVRPDGRLTRRLCAPRVLGHARVGTTAGWPGDQSRPYGAILRGRPILHLGRLLEHVLWQRQRRRKRRSGR